MLVHFDGGAGRRRLSSWAKRECNFDDGARQTAERCVLFWAAFTGKTGREGEVIKYYM